jgi:hypothetical protein
MLDREIRVGQKFFEETVRPTTSKIIFENKEDGIVEREITWTGEIKGYDSSIRNSNRLRTLLYTQ